MTLSTKNVKEVDLNDTKQEIKQKRKIPFLNWWLRIIWVLVVLYYILGFFFELFQIQVWPWWSLLGVSSIYIIYLINKYIGNEARKEENIINIFTHIRNLGIAFGVELLGFEIFSIGIGDSSGGVSVISVIFGSFFSIAGFALIWLDGHHFVKVMELNRFLKIIFISSYLILGVATFLLQGKLVTEQDVVKTKENTEIIVKGIKQLSTNLTSLEVKLATISDELKKTRKLMRSARVVFGEPDVTSSKTSQY